MTRLLFHNYFEDQTTTTTTGLEMQAKYRSNGIPSQTQTTTELKQLAPLKTNNNN